jgi:BirA family biotin operon repressor/biotin-[acetyl-CoA-carboxylase] ligase
MTMSDDLTPHAILDNLATHLLPRTVVWYPQVPSTMDVARLQLQQGQPPALPLLVLADEQTAGRGRMQRPWVAPPGSALLFSLALRPGGQIPPHQAQALVWMAGVALCEGIATATGLSPRLKWPNDVVLLLPHQQHPSQEGNKDTVSHRNSRYHKIAGILLESGSSSTAIEWAILGCGINVTSSPPPDPSYRYPPANLATGLGRPMARLPLLRGLLRHMDRWYARLCNGEQEQLFAAWRALLMTVGQDVCVETARGSIAGRAEDVDASGALLVRDPSGQVYQVTSGDVAEAPPAEQAP